MKTYQDSWALPSTGTPVTPELVCQSAAVPQSNAAAGLLFSGWWDGCSNWWYRGLNELVLQETTEFPDHPAIIKAHRKFGTAWGDMRAASARTPSLACEVQEHFNKCFSTCFMLLVIQNSRNGFLGTVSSSLVGARLADLILSCWKPEASLWLHFICSLCSIPVNLSFFLDKRL